MLSRWYQALGPGLPGALFYFGFFAAGAAFRPFLGVYFAHQGLSGSEIGMLVAIGPLMSLLVAPPISALADRRGWRVRLLCAALAGSALSVLAVPLFTSFLGLLLVIAVMSIVGSPVIPLADGLITRMAARRKLAYGRMRLWGSLGWAIVAAAGGALWQQAGFSLMFVVTGLLFLATVPIARMLPEERSREAQVRPPLKVVIVDPRVRVVLAATFVYGLALSVAAAFTGVYMDDLGGGNLLVGLFSAVTAMSELPVMHWSETIRRRLGGPWTLVLGYAMFGCAYLGLALIREPTLLLVAAVFQGFGFGLFIPTTVRLVAEWSPAEWTATSQGVLSAGLWGLAPLVAGPLGGLIYDTAGPPAVFLACLGAAVGAALVLLLAQLAGVFRAREEVPEEANQFA